MSGAEVNRMDATSRAEAEARAESIRTTAGHLLQQLTDAWDQQDHLTLGYVSWSAYCRGELDGRIALPRGRGDRRELVRALVEMGMSQRAVAEAVGMSRNTVARYVAPGVAQIEPPVVEHQEQEPVATEAEARELTDKLREALSTTRNVYQELQADPDVVNVLMDPWVIRAIQLEKLTPIEAVEAWDRVKNGPRAADLDGMITEQLIIMLLTRTGRWMSGYDPSIPLSEALADDDADCGVSA
jgi:transposase